MLRDNCWRRNALCCKELLADVEQIRLMWQASLAPAEHMEAKVSGLPFHWRPPEVSSERRTAY